MEFLRPQASRSSTLDRRMLRRTAASRELSSSFGRITHHIPCIRSRGPHPSAAAGSPVQGAQPPQVRETRHQHSDKYQDLHVPAPSVLTSSNSPSQDESGLQIKDDEKHRHQVVLDVEAKASGAGRLDARLKGLARGGIVVVLPKDMGEDENHTYQADYGNEVNHQL